VSHIEIVYPATKKYLSGFDCLFYRPGTAADKITKVEVEI
jgi:hypothetical protein